MKLYKCHYCKKTIFYEWERIYNTTPRFLRKPKLNWSMHKECFIKYENNQEIEKLIKNKEVK
ncbi:hypothetical protein [Spiroplasma endosymbiont of Villa modesta]|uniref:hypothetical protein n=1 Tax=Spiroplasma endosymbiont of Villa modesta TaxID=3066293 RepID=UPI00313EAA6A